MNGKSCERFCALLTAAAALVAAGVATGDLIFLVDEHVCRATPKTPYNHASTIIELPNGDLVVAWSRGTSEFSADEHVALSVLSAGKGKWSAPRVAAAPTTENAGNPVLFLDPKGRLWLFFNRRPAEPDRWWQPDRPFPHHKAYICCRVSRDGGRTWGPERALTREPGSQLRCPPIILANGDWLLPIHNERDMTALMLISTDGGKTWQRGEKMIIPGGGALTPDSPNYREGCIEPAVAQRKDGTIVCLARYMWGQRRRPPLTWQSLSRDNGRTWSAPRQIGLYNPNSGIALLRLRSGAWLLAFNDSPAERKLLTAAISDNEGRTWSIKSPLKSGMDMYSYPTLFQGGDGRIHMSYSFSRYDARTGLAAPDGIRRAAFTEKALRTHGRAISPAD